MTSPFSTVIDHFDPEHVLNDDIRFLNKPVASDRVLDVLGVPVRYARFIRMIDQDPVLGLELYHYLSTTHLVDPSPLSNNMTVNHEPRVDAQDSWVNARVSIMSVKGVIIDSSTHEIVCRSFPHIPEIEVSAIYETLNVPNEAIRYAYSREGVLLRVYYHRDQWVLSTNHRIHGSNGRWGDVTFGEAFEEAIRASFNYVTTTDDDGGGTGNITTNPSQVSIHVLLQRFDPNCGYSIVVSHPRNRLVYPQLLDAVVVSVWHRPSQRLVPHTETWLRQETFIADTTEDLIRVVESCPEDYAHSGVVVIDPSGCWPVRIFTEAYQCYKSVRGTGPNIRARYLHLLLPGDDDSSNGCVTINDDRQTTLQDFERMFMAYPAPTVDGFDPFITMLTQVRREIDAVVGFLYGCYIVKYVHKTYQGPFHREEHLALRKLHTWHLENRVRNLVTRDVVYESVFAKPYYHVAPIMKRLRSRSSMPSPSAPTVMYQLLNAGASIKETIRIVRDALQASSRRRTDSNTGDVIHDNEHLADERQVDV